MTDEKFVKAWVWRRGRWGVIVGWPPENAGVSLWTERAEDGGVVSYYIRLGRISIAVVRSSLPQEASLPLFGNFWTRT